MKKIDYVKKIYGKRVTIAIPNFKNPDKLFYISGVLEDFDVGNKSILLRTDNGIREIFLKDIREIREDG